MRLISKWLVFSIICFISSLSQAAPIDSTNFYVRSVATRPMTLCTQVYVNDQLMTSTNFQNALLGFVNPWVDANCQLTYSDGQARYEFLSTGLFIPVISVRVTDQSMMSCPANYPIPQAVILWADEGPSSSNYSMRAYCCRSGFNMRVQMVWVSGTSCP